MQARVLALLLAASVWLPVVTGADGDPVRPGDAATECTLSFVYDSAVNDSVYVSIAEHCVGPREEVALADGRVLGPVVAREASLDVALVEAEDAIAEHVEPGVRGHLHAPTGFTTPDETDAGDVLLMSGHGIPFSAHEATRENRSALLVEDNDHWYRSQAMVSFGDSGGPLVHAETGQAVGLVSAASPSPPPANLVGPTVQGLLEHFQDRGWALQLRTV